MAGPRGRRWALAGFPKWAWGYVNEAVSMGVINGYPDGTFQPGRQVTYGEAVTVWAPAAFLLP